MRRRGGLTPARHGDGTRVLIVSGRDFAGAVDATIWDWPLVVHWAARQGYRAHGTMQEIYVRDEAELRAMAVEWRLAGCPGHAAFPRRKMGRPGP